jgi:MFS family permease
VRRLVAANIASCVGTAMTAVAVAFIAYLQTKSVVLTGLVFSGNTLPFVILAPLSGRVITRSDVRYVLAAGQAAKALLWAGVTVAAGLGALTYELLLVANFAYGSASALMTAAWPRLIQLIAPPGRLPELTAMFKSTIPSVAAIAGALLGGGLLVTLGHTWVFGIDTVSYVPLAVALLMLPRLARLPAEKGGAVRVGLRFVRRTPALRRAFLLTAALNLAAFPILTALPAIAHEIDARGHVLGFLTGAFYAGAALVVWAVVRLRRRFSYSRILFGGFFGAGLLLVANSALTAWRDPGVDAVIVAAITLVPIGLAVALNDSLLQALVVLECPDERKGGVLTVYGTVAAFVTPMGGILLGVAIDASSLWFPVGCFGLLLSAAAVLLRRRLRIFDTLGSADQHERIRRSLGGHWHGSLAYSAGADLAAHPHPHDYGR